MVIEGKCGAFSGVACVHVWTYKLLNNIAAFLDETLVFSAELVINILEVELLVFRSEVVHNGVVG